MDAMGTGDFFGDGNAAILWQNDDGSVALWDMNGTNVVGGGLVGLIQDPHGTSRAPAILRRR